MTVFVTYVLSESFDPRPNFRRVLSEHKLDPLILAQQVNEDLGDVEKTPRVVCENLKKMMSIILIWMRYSYTNRKIEVALHPSLGIEVETDGAGLTVN